MCKHVKYSNTLLSAFNNKLIIQYGYTTWSASKTITKTITYPVAFITHWCVTCQSTGTGAFVGSNIISNTKTNFEYHAYGNNTERTNGVFWIATGY